MRKAPKVKDKRTFREWCHFMCLNTHHAAKLFGMSRPNIYKYLDESSPIEVREPVILACNLISEQPAEKRLETFKEALGPILSQHPWPAQDPIEKTAP